MSDLQKGQKAIVSGLILINGLGFLIVSMLMASGPLGWQIFIDLPWSWFLTDLGGISSMSSIDPGSVWIIWLIETAVTTLLYLLFKPASQISTLTTPQDGASLVKHRKFEIESRPELQARLSRLNQLLHKH